MPDWVGHLFVGAATGKALRLHNLRLILLGALLPDLAAIPGTLADFNWLPVDTYRLIFVLLPFSTPFAAVCLSAAIAVWFSRPGPACLLILLGALTHLALDVFQVGNVQLFLYPFGFKLFNWPIHNYGENGDLLISLAAIAILLALRLLPQANDIVLCARRGWLSIIPLALLAVVIASNAERMEASNIFNLRFLKGMPVPPNEPVSLISSLVISAHPPVVKKARREVEVVWREPLRQGEIISVWGHYRDHRLWAHTLVWHASIQKMVFSGIGGVILLLYWIRIPRLDERRREPGLGERERPHDARV